jgi:hypothetical protein
VKAKHLVEALLDDDGLEPVDGSSDPKERAYRRLHRLYTRRGELQSEQKWIADFHITLHRLHVDEDNIKSLDIRDGKLHGLWLKQGDYGAKIQRKAEAKAAQNKRLDAQHDERYPLHADNPDKGYYGRQFVPNNASPSEVSAYYVPIKPPLWVPESIRNRL